MLDSTTSADLHSLCYLRAEKAKGPYVSCGVFISPRRVLTTFHSVSGAKQLHFTAANGNITTIKRRSRGGIHFMNKSLDLAVVELEADTHNNFADVNFQGTANRGLFKANRGYLATMYQKKAKAHHVRFDQSGIGEELSRYQASVRAVEGFSGSPVYGADGFTIVSIATSIHKTRQESELRRAEIHGNTSPMISFNGPSLNAFSQFMRKANAKTNFDPSGPKI